MVFKLTSKPLSEEAQKAIIQEKLTWILAVSSPKKVILFGSAAQMKMTEASDIDLIVIYANDEDLKSSRDLLNRSRKPNDWPQDIIFHTQTSFNQSVSTGGGAAWLASREGQVLFNEGVLAREPS